MDVGQRTFPCCFGVYMMNRKLVIFDVDGTLVSRENILPPGVASAINTLQNNGHIAAFFTGRPFSHVLPSVKNIGFDGCICTMGAYVELEGEIAQNLVPDSGMARDLVRLVRSCDLDAAFESEDGIAFDETHPLSEFLAKLKKNFAERGFITDQGVDRENFSFSKLCVWFKETSDVSRFEREASKYLKVIGKKQNMMELVSKQVSIEESVGTLMSHFGVSSEDCYAIGDSINDLPMLRLAKYNAAMGEAPDELKSQVGFTTSGVMEGGLVKFLQHYQLI